MANDKSSLSGHILRVILQQTASFDVHIVIYVDMNRVINLDNVSLAATFSNS